MWNPSLRAPNTALHEKDKFLTRECDVVETAFQIMASNFSIRGQFSALLWNRNPKQSLQSSSSDRNSSAREKKPYWDNKLHAKTVLFDSQVWQICWEVNISSFVKHLCFWSEAVNAPHLGLPEFKSDCIKKPRYLLRKAGPRHFQDVWWRPQWRFWGIYASHNSTRRRLGHNPTRAMRL